MISEAHIHALKSLFGYLMQVFPMSPLKIGGELKPKSYPKCIRELIRDESLEGMIDVPLRVRYIPSAEQLIRIYEQWADKNIEDIFIDWATSSPNTSIHITLDNDYISIMTDYDSEILTGIRSSLGPNSPFLLDVTIHDRYIQPP
jgi:hypothetical protein